MAVGDAAAAAGMSLVDGATTDARDIDTEINRTRDYIASIPVQTVVPMDHGGTGATTQAAARTALGLPPRLVENNGTANTIRMRWTGGRVRVQIDATEQGDIAYLSDLPSSSTAYVRKSGDTMSGDLKIPNATPATSGYTVCYLNSDGRVSKGASSRRFKKNIRRARATDIPDVFAVPLSSFQMKGGDGAQLLGYIAEDMVAAGLGQFVVNDAEGRPESLDVVQFLLVQVSELHRQLVELRGS